MAAAGVCRLCKAREASQFIVAPPFSVRSGGPGFPAWRQGFFRNSDCFVWKCDERPFVATRISALEKCDFWVNVLLYRLLHAFLKAGSPGALCPRRRIYGNGMFFVCKKGGRKCLFFVGYDFLCNFGQLNYHRIYGSDQTAVCGAGIKGELSCGL